MLVDLGLDKAGELSAKAVHAAKPNLLTGKTCLSQTETACISGSPESSVSEVRHCKFQNISFERSMRALVFFDHHVEVAVDLARDTSAADAMVAL
ncbi:XRE family transcriptional regulator [Burkholderia vietnamiensis]|uniref:XRE family transcriptional regulator n=1 Tax=Burkholderia vietnamiensis TaxID=60552 RepID=UPI003F513BD9